MIAYFLFKPKQNILKNIKYKRQIQPDYLMLFIILISFLCFSCHSKIEYIDFIANLDRAHEVNNIILDNPEDLVKKTDKEIKGRIISFTNFNGKDALYIDHWHDLETYGFVLLTLNSEELHFSFDFLFPDILPTTVHAHPAGSSEAGIYIEDDSKQKYIFSFNIEDYSFKKEKRELILATVNPSNNKKHILNKIPFNFPINTWFHNSIEVKNKIISFKTLNKTFKISLEKNLNVSKRNKIALYQKNSGAYYTNFRLYNEDLDINNTIESTIESHKKYIHTLETEDIYCRKEWSKLIKKVLIGTTTKNSLIAPSESLYKYQLKILKNSQLVFSYGIIPVSWKNLHPTEFKIEIQNDDQSQTLFSEKLYPLTNPDHQKWQEAVIDLSQYEGKTIDILFKTNAVPANRDNLRNKIITYAAWGHPRIVSKTPVGKKKNIILISLDTLRKDRLGIYDPNITFTPNIDNFARQCYAFTNAISQSSWTSPSHMTMFTSLYTSQHNVYSVRHKLEDNIITLAEVLQQEEYITAAVTGGGYVAGELGFHQGFDSYFDSYSKIIPEDMTEVEHNVSLSIDWLKKYKNNPFFLFLHTYEIHSPFNHYDFIDEKTKEKSEYFFRQNFYETLYNPDAPFTLQESIEIVNKLYNGGIAFTDRVLGPLFDYLKESGLYENTIIILTSDHGETMGEHRDIFPQRLFNHGHSLYEELVRVPLLIHLPGQQSNIKADKMAGLIDLFPTVCSLLDIKVPGQCNGRSLFPIEDYEENILFMESHSEPQRYRRQVAVRTPEYKYILSQNMDKIAEEFPHASIPESEFYMLTDDPEELENIVKSQSETSKTFRETVISFMDAVQKESLSERTANLRQVNPELLKRLKSLGYLK